MTPLTLKILSQSKTKLVLGWDPVPNAEGFEYLVDGKRSNTWDGGTTQATFNAAAKSITVNALGVTAQGIYPPVAPPPPPPSASGVLRGAGNSATDFSGWKNVSGYDLLMCGGDGIPAAKNHAGLTILYSDAQIIPRNYSEGLSWATANANGWLLGPSGTGNVINLTIPAARAAVAQAAVQYVLDSGLKGLFYDDVKPIAYGSTPSGWRSAMVDLITQTHALCKQHGLYLAGNCSAYGDSSLGDSDDGTADIAWAAMLSLDAVWMECWEQTRDSTFRLRLRGNNWDQLYDPWMKVPAAITAQGKDFIGNTYGADNEHLYGLGSLLSQAANGRRVYFAAGGPTDSQVNVDPYGSWVSAKTVKVDPVQGTASA